MELNLRQSGSALTRHFPKAAIHATDRKILLYCESRDILASLESKFEDAGWNVLSANNADTALHIAERYVVGGGILFLNNEMPGDTLRDYRNVISTACQPFWLALIGERERMNDDVCSLVAEYCYDFFTPPFDFDRICGVLGHASGMSRISIRNKRRQEVCSTFQDMVGESPSMHRMFKAIRKISQFDAPVLISGESGTGKEMAARAIHQLSPRRDGPFVAVNTAALPTSLIQSELFGFEKGAFTGASQTNIGHIKAADGGTLFLDEIGDMPLPLQVNLLRFLENKIVPRLGCKKEISSNTRIICATHQNLEASIEKGTFREDLFYRLNVLKLEIPSLRERPSDIDALADYFSRKFGTENHITVKKFSSAAVRAMNNYSWPGNIREMKNRIMNALVVSEGRVISEKDLDLYIVNGPEEDHYPSRNMTAIRKDAEKKAIEDTLVRSRNNISYAARELGIARSTLYRKMERFDIQTHAKANFPTSEYIQDKSA